MKHIDLALRSEFSFRSTLQHIDRLPTEGVSAIGVADLGNTFSHIQLEKLCDKKGIKPIFGVRLMVVKNPKHRPKKGEGQGNYGPTYILIAKDSEGLREIYRLVKKSYDNFYYRANIGLIDVFNLSDSVFVIADHFEVEERIDYIAVNHGTSLKAMDSKIPKVFINNNLYPSPDMRETYQLMCGSRKTGRGYSYNFDSYTYPSHVLSTAEFLQIYDDMSAVENTHIIADSCDVRLPKADMVRYKGHRTIESWCKRGARLRGIDLNEDAYADRLDRELGLIEEKDYGDYFLNVAEMTDHAKKIMLVGPARGSAAGSLVCYLMGITEVDPIPHGLIFERFIDINRLDLPDIDIDFPDTKRGDVIKRLVQDHGALNVAHIANVSTFQPKSAIGDFAIGLDIPKFETEAVKGAIIQRSGGDARAAMCIQDTLESTDIGRKFIEQYPKMMLTRHIEGHAKLTSTHAAGVIICNEHLTNYCGVNTKDGTIMAEKKGAEYLNLLKIDVLGLRTLSVLEDCAELAGFDFREFYTLPLDDKEAFGVFNEMRLQGIFQFEGQALQFITRQIGVHEFNDIVAITSLARPGAMNSGGTARYVKYKLGKEKPVYRNDIHKSITEESMGIVIYQEQMMRMAKEIGNMTWEDVSDLRKAASKSLGDEFFSKFKDKFIKGATEDNGFNKDDAEALWKDISATGSWTFNKSHAVSYGLISYWTAWCKAHYPLEFAAANLNNSKNEDSAVRLLRDMVRFEGIEYDALDPDYSDINWSIANGKLIGGLMSVKGISITNARKIIKMRKGEIPYTPALVWMLMEPETPFIDIFPCQTRYGELYDNPYAHGLNAPPSKIEDVLDEGSYMIIGILRSIDLRDRNDYQSVVKRGGEYVDKNQFYLKMFVEDDTDSIMVMIPPHKFDDMNARYITENSKVDETYFLIKGDVRSDWRMITIDAIHDITDWRPE